ncbi:MAG: S8 family peptidase [Bacteroidota bacterium]
MKHGLLLFILSLIFAPAFGQVETHLVLFTDKTNTPFSISSPEEYLSPRAIARRQRQGISIKERDLPVDPEYVQQLRDAGADVRYTTRWMNGVIIDADLTTLLAVQQLPFVKSAGTISFETYPSQNYSSLCQVEQTETEDYGNAQAQNEMLGIDLMNEEGYYGEGMVIAVFDEAFGSVPRMRAFEQLDLLGTYDFIDDETDVFDGGSHGQRVLSAMAAYVPGEMVGGAYKASYYLFSTEDGPTESRAEEAYFLVAAERSDSLGVDVITCSLGYSDFDNPTYNYTPADLDGNTALITRAADWAAATGMLVVTSAGNRGNDEWGALTFPADGDSVLAVGAVASNGQAVSFSSFGSVSGDRVKPNVSALGLNTTVWFTSDLAGVSSGTSFASPLVTTLAIGLWEANPDKTNMEIIEAIERSGNLFLDPDDQRGYGIPNFQVANAQLVLGVEDEYLQGIQVFPNPVTSDAITLRFSDAHQGTRLKIRLMDLQGRTLLRSQSVEVNQGDVRFVLPESLPKGVVLLHLESPTGSAIFKLFKP